MTLHEFYAKIGGFNWSKTMEARNRAELVAAIYGASGNLKKGSPKPRPEQMVPANLAHPNIFYRRWFGLD